MKFCYIAKWIIWDQNKRDMLSKCSLQAGWVISALPPSPARPVLQYQVGVTLFSFLVSTIKKLKYFSHCRSIMDQVTFEICRIMCKPVLFSRSKMRLIIFILKIIPILLSVWQCHVISSWVAILSKIWFLSANQYQIFVIKYNIITLYSFILPSLAQTRD